MFGRFSRILIVSFIRTTILFVIFVLTVNIFSYSYSVTQPMIYTLLDQSLVISWYQPTELCEGVHKDNKDLIINFYNLIPSSQTCQHISEYWVCLQPMGLYPSIYDLWVLNFSFKMYLSCLIGFPCHETQCLCFPQVPNSVKFTSRCQLLLQNVR